MIKINIDSQKTIRQDLFRLSLEIENFIGTKLGKDNTHLYFDYNKDKELRLTVVVDYNPDCRSYTPTWAYKLYVRKRTEYYSEKDECLYGLYEYVGKTEEWKDRMYINIKGYPNSFKEFIGLKEYKELLEEVVKKFNKNK